MIQDGCIFTNDVLLNDLSLNDVSLNDISLNDVSLNDVLLYKMSPFWFQKRQRERGGDSHDGRLGLPQERLRGRDVPLPAAASEQAGLLGGPSKV